MEPCYVTQTGFQFLVSLHPPTLGFQVGTAGDVAMPGHKVSLLVGRYTV